MKAFAVASLVACASAAPHSPLLGAVGYAAAPASVYHGSTVQEHIVPAGPAIHKTHVQHGIVGHRDVQVGTQTYVAGHQYSVKGQTLQARPDETYVAEPAKAYTNTVALPEPALPYAAAPAAFGIPAAPTNQGPAPADTVVRQPIKAAGRVNTVITPQRTHIVPELQVNKVPYDVIQKVAVPVEREVIVTKKVAKPYIVEVEQPYHVPVAVPVDTVRDQYVTPVVHKHTASVTQPIAVAHAAPAVAYAHAPAAAYAHAPAAAYAHAPAVAYAQAAPAGYIQA